MPVTTYVLSGDFGGLVGEVSKLRATVHANSEDGAWVNETDNVIRLGGALLDTNASGVFTVTLPTSTGTGLQYDVRVEYVDASRTRQVWSSGWFDLTANADLADLANNSSLRVNPSLGAQLASRIDGYVDHGNVSGVLTIDPSIGTHVIDATGALLVTLDSAPDGYVVTLLVASGADNVTIDGVDATLTDGAFASFVRIRGAWVLAASGAAAGPADTTPPTAITDLTATGGQGQVTLTFTMPTDGETTAHVGYKVWLTSGTEPTTYTTASASPIVVTGLPAGAYSAKVYSYSNGGSTVADTATATVTAVPGWSVFALDNFDGSGVVADRHPDTTGTSLTWTKGTPGTTTPAAIDLNVAGGKASLAATNGGTAHWLPITGGAPSAEITLDIELAAQPDSSIPTFYLWLNSPTGAGTGIYAGCNSGTLEVGAGEGKVVTMTGSTAGFTGRHTFTFRVVSDGAGGMLVTILLDGATVMSGTTAWSQSHSYAYMNTQQFGGSFVHSAQIRVYT